MGGRGVAIVARFLFVGLGGVMALSWGLLGPSWGLLGPSWGHDPAGMAAALRDAIVSRGANLRGASTITQQVMKNFLLDGSRSAERKIKELILATRIEGTLDKEGILELYLNEIFLGQNSFGAAAAAQTYFNKPLEVLLPEHVLLPPCVASAYFFCPWYCSRSVL